MQEQMQIGISELGFPLSVDRTKKVPPAQLFKQSVQFDANVFFQCLKDAGIGDVRAAIIYIYIYFPLTYLFFLGVARRIWI
jgi:hypothetical protein